ncbi:hypothetical protein MFLAVUS_001826 [Mucor flavus]|uniref:Uncharacterized protein n=1 Tax=Mucor flavus TaxID=439312 RepID=A0ABP9YNJ6_9FUNG
MSKLILNNDDVINIVVSVIIGDNASNKYSTKPTEWPNFKRSDVLYCPLSRKDLKSHPPLLIEIQYSADMNFFHCFLINKQTVSDHLENKPLEPLVALAHFIIEGKSALVSMEKGDDETIKKLYTIAKQIVSHEILNEKTSTTAFEELYCHAINGLNQTKEILLETPNTEDTNKRAIDCLESYTEALGNIHKKRFEETPADNCETLSVESASTFDTPSFNVSTSATISIPSSSRGLKREDRETNWEFISEYRTQHGSNMDWEKCFSEGKKKGLLQQYSTPKSLKAAFYRYKC